MKPEHRIILTEICDYLRRNYRITKGKTGSLRNAEADLRRRIWHYSIEGWTDGFIRVEAFCLAQEYVNASRLA